MSLNIKKESLEKRVFVDMPPLDSAEQTAQERVNVIFRPDAKYERHTQVEEPKMEDISLPKLYAASGCLSAASFCAATAQLVGDVPFHEIFLSYPRES
ncbi:uncharacterized protein MONOS_10005 [Monocercomonoides exilis]|uniref:uncharacterized protein n=1 Tax=Monocercomonoides exilis TaxID=2049356 RepID=UPI00355987C6|nr:hypothetical protein MONOS_10005 [Monocercomonoides exilis]|eukprot:MONOS_10005.1-p1 / transcript=MONOS_10005.1 / gene=MONOS_10005 / organism=Monocercomonoides_exilis_PA203 / gene_product=unspecified product / transcript_product=unspecified product / location=Mono_scaffold00436:32992-33552(+) / protein_length=98 / sequence_SO=supercontig / SO=protein_coding / is_pseudo=false